MSLGSTSNTDKIQHEEDDDWQNPPSTAPGRLIGRTIRIWWDGDATFYEAQVTGFENGLHSVQYAGEDDSVFHEDLSPSSATSWQLRRDDDAPATRSKPSVNYAPVKKGSYQTYADMCVNAVRDLGEAKSGWSLAAIRKHVAINHPETNKKHTASFNALTLKALNKAVAEGILERTSKTAYRLTQAYQRNEQQKRRDAAMRAGGSAALQYQLMEEAQAAGGDSSLKGGIIPEGLLGRLDLNRAVRREMETALIKRNEFLSGRRGLLAPFMPEGENFFTKLDRDALLQQLAKEQLAKAQAEQAEQQQRDAAAAAEQKAKDQEAQRAARAQKEKDREAQRKQAEQQRQQRQQQLEEQRRANASSAADSAAAAAALAAEQQRQPFSEAEFKALPVDDATISETLLRLGLVSAREVIPGSPLVTLIGQPWGILPPLQVSAEGFPVMRDIGVMGQTIPGAQPFAGFTIVWPGQPLPVTGPQEISQFIPHMDYTFVYFLEKREPAVQPQAVLGPQGWYYPVSALTTAGKVLARTTALRQSDGSFVPHKTTYMQRTQSYASRTSVPLGNLVTFVVRDPRTGEKMSVTRQYCAEQWYTALYRKLLRDQLRKNPGLVVVIRQMQQRALGITSSTGTNTTTSTGAAVNGQMSTRGATRSSTTTAAAAAAAAASAAAVAKPVLTPEATRQAVIQWETHVQGLPIDPNTTGGQAWVTHYDVLLKAANGLPVSIPLLKHVQARLAYARKGMGLPPEPPLYRFTDTGFELYTTPTTAVTAAASAADDEFSDVGSSAAAVADAIVADAISGEHSAQLSSNGDTSDSNRLGAVKAEDAVAKHDGTSSSNADGSAMAVDTSSSSAGTTLPTAAETAAVAAAADVKAHVKTDVKAEVKPEEASTTTAADATSTAVTDGAAAGDTIAVTTAAADTEAADVPTATATATETDVSSSSADASTDAAVAQSATTDSAVAMETDTDDGGNCTTANGTAAAVAGDTTTAAAATDEQLATAAAIADSTNTAVAVDTTDDTTAAAAAADAATTASNGTDTPATAEAAAPVEAAMDTDTTASNSTTAAAATDGESQLAVEEVRRLSKSEAEALAVAELSGFDPRDVLKGVTRLPAPSSITATMHAHQLDGLSWMVHMYSNGMPMILGDQMGLGKTLQSIAFMAHLKHTLQASGPFLVVVPLSVISNWLAEIERFCPRLRPVRFHGPKEERSRIKSDELAASSEFDVVITTFEMLTAESNWFKTMVRCIATACCLAAAVLQVQAAAPTAPSGLHPARRAALTLRGGRARAVLTEAKIDELRTQGPPLVPAHGTCDSRIAEHAVPEGEMSLGTGILNLVADLCPHGMLPVAFGMAAAGGTGVLAAPALLAVFGATSAYTLISLGRASERTGQYSFSGLWANLIGRDTAWIIEVAFAVMTFGCCVFYSAFIGDLFASLANTVSWVPALLQRRAVTLTALSVFPLLPLCLMKNLSALQPTSFGGLVSILYTVWFVVKRAVDGSYAVGGQFFDAIDTKYRNPLKDSWGSVGLWTVGPGTVTLMNMCCVAFMAHYNGVKYYEELEHRTVKRYATGISTGVAICFCVFSAMMLFGFKTFGTASQTLLLNNYHRTDDSLATLARLATGCAILCGYPLMFAALKTSGLNAAHEISRKFKSTQSLAPRFLNDDGLRTACAVGALSTITAIACNKSEEDVAVVVGLIGALLGGGANFVIPAILNLRIFARDAAAAGQQQSHRAPVFSEANLNRLLIVAGAAFMVVGTASVVQDAQHGHH